ncbi:MAG TPA: hypothetical protein VG326_14260 [Tepidisphaeraceae bacterium]|jgi:hypothetical protein|nr:hypothetical protein [Tepidisphaeraceae bacterium]
MPKYSADGTLGTVNDPGRFYLADYGDGAVVTPHLVDYSYLGLSTFVGQADGNGVSETTSLADKRG